MDNSKATNNHRHKLKHMHALKHRLNPKFMNVCMLIIVFSILNLGRDLFRLGRDLVATRSVQLLTERRPTIWIEPCSGATRASKTTRKRLENHSHDHSHDHSQIILISAGPLARPLARFT